MTGMKSSPIILATITSICFGVACNNAFVAAGVMLFCGFLDELITSRFKK